MPGTCGRCRLRPLPAHSSVFTTECVSSFESSARVRVKGFSTSPPTVRRQVAASSSLGSCMWLRTKKCGTGVSHVLKYSTGVSRSRNREERTIKPFSPGMSMVEFWEAAHDKRGEIALPASAAAEACFKKLRLEFIACQLVFAKDSRCGADYSEHRRPGKGECQNRAGGTFEGSCPSKSGAC